MAYQSVMYISQYLPKLISDMDVHLIWDGKFINKIEGKVLLRKVRMNKVKGNKMTKIYNNFANSFLSISHLFNLQSSINH